MNFSGTAPDAFSHMFEGVEQVDCFLKGEMTLYNYERFIEDSESSICSSNLQRHLLYLSSRYPKKVDQFDKNLLAIIPNKLKISEEDLNSKFNIYKELVRSVFMHDNYLTYIYPEEERLLFIASMIIKPKRVLVAGSYY